VSTSAGVGLLRHTANRLVGEDKERWLTPSLSVQQWDETLRAAGFNGIDLEVKDSQGEQGALSVIIATAV
jgi:hypothetical protein